MNTTTQLSGFIRGIITQPTGGIVGLVDDLLVVCSEHGLQLDWQANRCRFRSSGANWEELTDLALPKSVFRAIIARVAALCNERTPNSVSPYGGNGKLVVGANAKNTLDVAFDNTSGSQKLELFAPISEPTDS